jgi:hypothetical protein
MLRGGDMKLEQAVRIEGIGDIRSWLHSEVRLKD